ncbi:MAG: prepilin-type N-terminal cleavage/methylation domain-containing protein [candidate division WOR-3 bacterium]|nr:MAG: prepilin-type N-terminal cleavage/methylation domain-containing protein [candidate division WOR-3 bacterium]
MLEIPKNTIFFTFNFLNRIKRRRMGSRLTFKSGITLVELLVSLVILMFVLSAIYTLLNLQTSKATQVDKTATLQTDAQVALTLLKWDLLMAGLGYPKNITAVQSDNGGAFATDAIDMRAVALGFESGRVKWSWLLEKADLSNTIKVRRCPDSLHTFQVNDTIVILGTQREVLQPGNLVIADIDTLTFFDVYGTPVPALALTLDKAVSAIAGLVVIGYVPSIYGGVNIGVANNKLVRGGDTLLENVEDIQFAYGIDNDGDGVIESYFDDIPNFASAGRKWVIRYTMVVTSRPIGGYTYPSDTIAIEDHSYTLNAIQKRQQRVILSGIIAPQNLQP